MNGNIFLETDFLRFSSEFPSDFGRQLTITKGENGLNGDYPILAFLEPHGRTKIKLETHLEKEGSWIIVNCEPAGDNYYICNAVNRETFESRSKQFEEKIIHTL